ncbi:MAG TPA: hypothetical protein PLO63_14815 [Syntrophales bacterium]|nr:hypothetical protein [Syntrophales bacterium]
MNTTCPFCRKDIELGDRIGRRETCPLCGRDLHVCLCCLFYAPGSYNDCREPQAERVVVKDRSNFCDFYSFLPPGEGTPPTSPKPSPKDALESLFKK